MKSLSIILGTLLLALGMAPHAHAGKADDTIYAAFRQPLQSLDFYYSPGREGLLLGLWIYDGLVYRNPATGQFEPLLAHSWKQIDNLTLEFKLRPGVKFQDGSVLNADDVVYTLNFVSDPANKVFLQTLVSWIDKAEKIDSDTVRIIARQVTPQALDYLSKLPIYSKAYYQSAGRDGMGRHPIGTGPYKGEIGPNGTFIFTRFDDYFSASVKGKANIRRLVYRTIPDVNTQVAELMTGSLDWAYYIPNDQAQLLRDSPQLKVVNADTLRIAFLTMDAAGLADAASPLKKPQVRQAISYAIDRAALAKNLVGSSSHVIDTPCFPSQTGCSDDVRRYDFDRAKARSLMAAAGYPNGFDIDIYGYRDRSVADAIVGDLQAIGIRANLHWLVYPAVVQKRRDNGTPMVIDDWGSSSINDVSASLSFFYGGAGDDQTRDPAVAAAIVQGDHTVDTAARKAKYLEALKRIADQAYGLPLFTMPINYVISSDLNMPIAADEFPEFWRASWK